jgi:enoyl-CoA hydratase/carnithine racemase
MSLPASGPPACCIKPPSASPPRSMVLKPRLSMKSIVLGANDFDGDTAERYGYVNRALPDAELDGFVDVLARRIASFDRRPIAAAKNLINQVSLPYADRLLDALNAFQTALTWPETQQRIQALLKRGLQQEGDFENRWPALLGTLLKT